MNAATFFRAKTLAKYPGATCSKEGPTYVVRDTAGNYINAAPSRSGAWTKAGKSIR